MATTPESFGSIFWVFLIFSGRQSPARNGTVEVSHLTTNWQRASDFAQPTFVQYNCWTERFIGPTEFQSGYDSRERVMRLVMDFWMPLDDSESEEDAIGPTGQMHDDFDLFGSPEYWRDVFPKGAGYRIERMAEGSPPRFSAENIAGILMHWQVSVGLVCRR